MQVKELMSRDVQCISPDDTIQTAAQQMRKLDVGSMPICENDRLVGMLTDRDIVIRTVAEGFDVTTTTARSAMTPEVNYCWDDQDVAEATKTMKEKQIRRLLVLNHDHRLAGMLSLGDLATHSHAKKIAEETLESVSQ